jgi:hypothetical protein
MQGYLPENQKKVTTLGAKSLKLKIGIFDEGKRLSVKEWTKRIYGTETGSIHSLIATLRRNGFYIVNAPVDPSDPDKGRCLQPLTSSKDICRWVNGKMANSWEKSYSRAHGIFGEELTKYKDLKGEIGGILSDNIEKQAALRKMFV